jgi:3-hydroxyisobutyrate dehydrogenase-like beta-hydroxyacid dehydrogenase
MAQINDVGVIGLGRMGLSMARHLLSAKYSVRGFDTSSEAVQAAQSAGIVIMESAARIAAQSDAVILLVGFDSQVEQVLFGEDGIVAGARPGTILMIASTVAPSYMKDLANRVADLGLIAIDIPVARGEAAARSGELLVFAGGDQDAVEHCRPLMETFSDRIVYLGAAGAGQTAKAINNMLLWTCLAANVEGLDLGEALGVDRETLREALCHSSGANWALESRADERPALWAEKDMDLLLGEAANAGITVPISKTTRDAIWRFPLCGMLFLRADWLSAIE